MSDSRKKWFYYGARVFCRFEGHEEVPGVIAQDHDGNEEWYLLQDVKSGSPCSSHLREKYGHKYSWVLTESLDPEEFEFDRDCNAGLIDIRLAIPWLYPYAEIELTLEDGDHDAWYDGMIVLEADDDWCILSDVIEDYDPRGESRNEGHFDLDKVNRWEGGMCLGKFNPEDETPAEWIEDNFIVGNIRLRNVEKSSSAVRQQGNFRSGDLVDVYWDSGEVSRAQYYECPYEGNYFVLQNRMEGAPPERWREIQNITGWEYSWCIEPNQRSSNIKRMEFVREGHIALPEEEPDEEDGFNGLPPDYDPLCGCGICETYRALLDATEPEEGRSTPIRISWDDF